MGSIYRRGRTLWIKYYRDGVAYRESTESDKEGVAKKLLKRREGDVERGIPVTPQTNRVLFDELAKDVLTDYTVNGKRSIANVERAFRLYIVPHFRGKRAAAITTADVRKYIAERQAAGAKNATVNRELAYIRRAFSLGMEGKITQKPKITMLRENNTRVGFFEAKQFEDVRSRLAPDLQPVVTFAYLTGWRTQSEILPLQWRHVDFVGGTVRLDPGTTKNDEARTFPLTLELRALLEAQRAHTEALQRDLGQIIPWVFHRNGKRILYFYKAWNTACTAAGVPGRILHDFRRTGVRALVRCGIPERVAMGMTGHKTRSVFERYNIVSEGDLTDAARRIDEKLTGTITGTKPDSEATAASAGAAK